MAVGRIIAAAGELWFLSVIRGMAKAAAGAAVGLPAERTLVDNGQVLLGVIVAVGSG